MTKTKRLVGLLLVATLLAGAWGYRAWQAHQASLARLAAEQRTEAEWDRLQAAETERLARELQAGLQLARTRVEEIAAKARRRVSLSVATNPAGATLRIHPADAASPPVEGSTPFTREFPKGSYRLSLALAGYETREESVDLAEASQSLRIELRPLSPPKPEPQPQSQAPALIIPQAEPKPSLPLVVSLPAALPDSFTNSLGMPFTRLPGSAVHFSIWLTREQDYQAFVRATARPWNNAASGPNHPAVNLSWQDARDFCAWLTEQERKAGRLTPGQVYRLPTDAEWSRAAGLVAEGGDSPKAKDGRVADVFPWGRQWPPPANAGNYGPSLGVDNFARTSPVNAFPANSRGLHDMGGNVWQWCGDDYDPAAPGTKVLRGASFSRYARGYLLSSFRHHDLPTTQDAYTGFRCVLESMP